jgi:hypothetical protein
VERVRADPQPIGRLLFAVAAAQGLERGAERGREPYAAEPWRLPEARELFMDQGEDRDLARAEPRLAPGCAEIHRHHAARMLEPELGGEEIVGVQLATHLVGKTPPGTRRGQARGRAGQTRRMSR